MLDTEPNVSPLTAPTTTPVADQPTAVAGIHQPAYGLRRKASH
jgi:hypothetical protein